MLQDFLFFFCFMSRFMTSTRPDMTKALFREDYTEGCAWKGPQYIPELGRGFEPLSPLLWANNNPLLHDNLWRLLGWYYSAVAQIFGTGSNRGTRVGSNGTPCIWQWSSLQEVFYRYMGQIRSDKLNKSVFVWKTDDNSIWQWWRFCEYCIDLWDQKQSYIQTAKLVVKLFLEWRY